VGSSWRYFGCAVGFGFGVMWMTVGIGSAILVLLCAALGYGMAFVAEHERAGLKRVRPSNEPVEAEDQLLLDEFELDRFERHDADLPDDERAPVFAEADYGWPGS
jgi:hypothetical protein